MPGGYSADAASQELPNSSVPTPRGRSRVPHRVLGLIVVFSPDTGSSSCEKMYPGSLECHFSPSSLCCAWDLSVQTVVNIISKYTKKTGEKGLSPILLMLTRGWPNS